MSPVQLSGCTKKPELRKLRATFRLEKILDVTASAAHEEKIFK